MNNNIVRLEGELTVSNAVETKSTIMTILKDSEKTTLDLSGITEIDTAGLQLLLLLVIEAKKMGRAIHLTSFSNSVKELFQLLGINNEIDKIEAKTV